jgi:2-polyprenyl-6-methoxyphenol hydroxylase-like FAD-dependent oxidoreductase
MPASSHARFLLLLCVGADGDQSVMRRSSARNVPTSRVCQIALVGGFNLRARDEITESKEKNPAAGRNAGKESGVYA